MKNGFLACLIIALCANTADSMATPAKARPANVRPHQSSVETNAHRPARHSTPSNSPNGAKAQPPLQKALAGSKSDKGIGTNFPARFIVAIDAGHGGRDTGAIGPRGTLEKDVVYAIARKLEKLIRAEPGMAAVLVRRGDTYIEPARRAEIARNAKADLFLSLHADAYADETAKGSSVFTRLLHRNERGDFSRNTLKASNRAAGRVLVEMRKKHTLHYRHVKRARFVVLKSPDVPSMLIETGFISNPDEERNLASQPYQQNVARSIFNGIRAYFRAFMPSRLKTAKARPIVVAYRQ